MRKITIPLKNVRGKDKFGKILTESVHRGHDKQGGAVFIQCIVAKKNLLAIQCSLAKKNLQNKPHIFVMFIVSYYASITTKFITAKYSHLKLLLFNIL